MLPQAWGAGRLVERIKATTAAVRTDRRDRYREREADRAFERRDRPSVLPDSDAPRHIICIVIDALRADTVSPSVMPFVHHCTPNWAVSPSTWTFPAVSSILTGQYPHEHGAIRRTDMDETAIADITPLPPSMDDNTMTLPDALAGAGYETYGGFAMIVPFLALRGRFSTHHLLDGASAGSLLDDHGSWLDGRADGRTFSYLHLADLHEPVDPPGNYWDAHGVDRTIAGIRRWRYEDVPDRSPTVDRYRSHRIRLYEAAAEYVDDRLAASLGRLTDWLDDVLVVITSDHGEGFWDRSRFHYEHFADPRPAHCVGHGGAPYEAITRVPLAIFANASTPIQPDRGTDSTRSSLIDITPTILDAVGLDDGPVGNSQPLSGTSLLQPIPDRRLVVEGVRYGYEKKAVYDGDRKLIVSHGDDVTVGFSLPDGEPCDLPDSVERSMLDSLPPWPDGSAPSGCSRAVERRLLDLGYT